MICSKERKSIVGVGVSDQDLIYLLVDRLSRRCCVSCRNGSYQADVVIDECFSGKRKLAAVSLQLSGRQFVICEYIVLQLTVFRDFQELSYRSCDVVIVVCLEVFQASLFGPLVKIGLRGAGRLEALFNALNQREARKRSARHGINAKRLTGHDFIAFFLESRLAHAEGLKILR